ncbi:conjugal transfer protein TraF [Azospirillum sp. SYSU D00513]|uniref:conjugal transfer protein TraF n=1 Tax=Azospirillum sp. SYSU D00513 TaxID=2812561 RepID=UPI002494CCF1|nr:conjugal transfer protein TraF [Azospirillum sp. SYSU D00513]
MNSRKLLCQSLTAALLAGSMAMPASAQQQGVFPSAFFGDSERGWFWYEVEPEPEPEPEPPPPKKEEPPPAPPEPAPTPVAMMTPPAAPAQPEPPPFGTAEWMRQNLPKFRDRALDEPTAENVRAYFYLQKIAVDKAQAFTDMQQRVVMGDPMLDEVGRRPTATYGANLQNQVAGAATDEQLKAIAQTAGIFFFYRSDCQYCDRQAPVLEAMARNYGFEVVAISLDGKPLPGGHFPDWRPDTGQASKLKVERTPTMFLVKAPDGFVALANGVLSMEDLRRRILLGAVTAGWIDEKSFDRTRPVDVVQQLPAKLDPEAAGITDPNALVDYLRSKVRN